MSMLFGFGTTLAAAKKKDPHFFDQGFSGAIENPKPTAVQAATATRHAGRSIKMEPGASLALRALGWGTLYSVAGCSVLFYTIWKLLDVGNVSPIAVIVFFRNNTNEFFEIPYFTGLQRSTYQIQELDFSVVSNV